MTTVVLVHGAWHGAWCWRRVMPVLEEAGHRVVPVTLSGLGERAAELSPSIRLATHVSDVVTAVREAGCRGAVLVGHSYGGLVVTGTADRLGEEVGRLVYVDAVVPTPGESWADGNPPETRAARRAAIAERGHIPPPPASVYGSPGTTRPGWSGGRRLSRAGPTRRRCTSTADGGPPGRARTSTAPRRRCRPSTSRAGSCGRSRGGSWSSWPPATTRW
ncbi:alpha/beta fold hydrolase [Geodermatophilus chilensis]|uniref:alpha/beta fold hydrolase n=1 Tax=Geodermatophilus chilensis TaxID=2035835 RepID=UPI0018E46FA7|nr:alpha/beta hydrolase [Geodermatophilus chilensis]